MLQNTVYSFSMKVCGHPEDAEDTMQEVLFRSLEHLAKIQDPQELAVWLYTVTRNRCWRMRRKPAHAPANILSLDELMPSDEELGLLLQDAGKSPEGNLLARRAAPSAASGDPAHPGALAHCSRAPRYGGVDHRAGCADSPLQQGTVRIRLHRARLSVRKEMNQLLSGAPEDSESCQNASRKGQRRQGPRGSGAPMNAAICLPTSLNIWMEEWSLLTCDQMRGHIEACPSCVAFLRDLRAAIDRCRSLEIPCDSGCRASIARHPYTGIPAHAGSAGRKINISRSCNESLLSCLSSNEEENHDGSEDYAS